MDSQRVLERIRTGEDSGTEFKGLVYENFAVNDPLRQKIAKAVVAFANSGGGWLLLGIEDDRSVTGLGTMEQADRTQRDVADICQGRIEPPITCRLTKVEIAGSFVLVVEVTGWSPDRPYRSKADHVRYVREGSRSREARPEEEKRLLESGVRVHYDEEAVPNAVLSDLDMDEVSRFLAGTMRPASEPEQVKSRLRAFKCVTRHDEPTVAGILFFGREVSAWLPDARVTVARVPGTEISMSFLDRKELEGRLTDQLDGARKTLALYYPAPARIEGWERLDSPGPGGIPEEVVREAIVNALMHRDYRIAAQTRILAYDDRIEIINPGTLLNEMDIDNIRIAGITQRRNPVLANLLLRQRSAELQGSGVPAMISLMGKAGLPEPGFECVAGQFKVTLRLPKAPA